MLIGGHVSTRGGIDRAVDVALGIGAEVIQTHPSLVRYLDLAERLGADGVVFHPGSHKGAGFEPMLPTIGAALREVLARSSSPARLLVENSAGQGGCVGCRFEEVGAILDVAGDDPRLGVCLDTCHAFAQGYDLATPAGVEAALAGFEAAVGFDRLALVHANDSRVELGGMRDRHANIGEGCIGAAGFGLMINDPRLAAVPWVLEVPGDGQGPDLANVNRLRDLAGMAPAVSRVAVPS